MTAWYVSIPRLSSIEQLRSWSGMICRDCVLKAMLHILQDWRGQDSVMRAGVDKNRETRVPPFDRSQHSRCIRFCLVAHLMVTFVSIARARTHRQYDFTHASAQRSDCVPRPERNSTSQPARSLIDCSSAPNAGFF